MKKPSYPDLIRREQIQAYLRKHTGILVSKQRIGRWITAGEIRLIKIPQRQGGGWWTRKSYLNELIRHYSD